MSVMGFNAGLALQAALVTEKAAIAASSLARCLGIDQLDTKYDLDGSVQRLRSDRPVKG